MGGAIGEGCLDGNQPQERSVAVADEDIGWVAVGYRGAFRGDGRDRPNVGVQHRRL